MSEEKVYTGIPPSERTFEGVPVLGGLESLYSYLSPTEYPIIEEPKTTYTEDMGRRYTSTTPGVYGEPRLAVPAAVQGGIDLYRQFVDKPVETAKAMGEGIASIPKEQMLGAQAIMEGADYAYDPETKEEYRFDPFLVTAPVAAGTAISIARTAGNDGSTVLGIMGGRRASSGAQKEKEFIDAKDSGLSDRDAYAETNGYIEPSDNAFRFEIDTSDAKLSKNYFEDSPVRDTEGIPYQRFQFEKFEQAQGRPPTLSDMLDFKELYKQYPDIGSVKVKRVPLGSSMDVKAAYDPIEKVIYVGTAGPKKMISNILHEVQHAVQHKEGFVSGSSTARYLPEGFIENFKALQTGVSENSEDLLSSKTGFFKKTSFEDRAKEKDVNVYRFNLGKKAKAYFEGDTESYDYVDFSEFASKEELQELQKIAKSQTEVDSLELQVIKAGRQYFRQPGEVEARTVQKKFEEGRQGEFPLDVQDVAPEDYIYRIDGKPGVSEMSSDDFTSGLKNLQSSKSKILSLTDRDEAFKATANLQRGTPEVQMDNTQDLMGGGVLSYAIEHGGDLLHRMTDRGGRAALEDTAPKVKSLIRSLESEYGFGSEFTENMRSNYRSKLEAAKSQGEEFYPTFEDYEDAVLKNLDNYAAYHSQLPVFNELQQAARNTAISLGKRDFGGALNNLRILDEAIEEGSFAQRNSSFDPKFETKAARMAEGGVITLADAARNTGRGPRGVASLASTARNMNRPMVS